MDKGIKKLRGLDKADELGDAAKVAEELGEAAEAADGLEGAAKAVDNLGEAAELAEELEEATKVLDKMDDVEKVADEIGEVAGAGGLEGGTSTIKSSDLVFGSSTKSTQKLMNQMNSRGWTEDLVRNTVDNPYTIRASINKATGNSATVFYTQQGSYVIVDDVTKAIVQISDNINPASWIPDLSIVNPYIPD